MKLTVTSGNKFQYILTLLNDTGGMIPAADYGPIVSLQGTINVEVCKQILPQYDVSQL